MIAGNRALPEQQNEYVADDAEKRVQNDGALNVTKLDTARASGLFAARQRHRAFLHRYRMLRGGRQ